MPLMRHSTKVPMALGRGTLVAYLVPDPLRQLALGASAHFFEGKKALVGDLSNLG